MHKYTASVHMYTYNMAQQMNADMISTRSTTRVNNWHNLSKST